MNGNAPFVQGGTVDSIFDLEGEARLNYLRSIGATNVDPPLPRSKYLKIKASGRVLPWDELLADQRELVECCDASGNTDPSAWMADVLPDDAPLEDREILLAQARAHMLSSSSALTSGYEVTEARDADSVERPYPQGIVALEDISELTNDLKSLVDRL